MAVPDHMEMPMTVSLPRLISVSPVEHQSSRTYKLKLNDIVSAGISFVSSLIHRWEKLQVGHSGKYSVQRVQALDTYCRSTSRLRVALVCMLTPLPALAFVLLVESMPLDKPDKGWKANYVMWLRYLIRSLVMAQSFLLQAKQVLPELQLCWWEALLLAFAANCIQSGLLLFIASSWIYPVPFMSVLTGAPYAMILICFIAMWLRRTPKQESPTLTFRFGVLAAIISTQILLVLIYPIYSAVYTSLHGGFQLAFTLMSYAIKLCMENLMAANCKSAQLDDYIPEITVFSIDLFHALFLTSCIKTSGFSTTTTFLIIVAHATQSILAVGSVLEHSRHSKMLLAQMETGQSPNIIELSVDFSKAVQDLCEDTYQLEPISLMNGSQADHQQVNVLSSLQLRSQSNTRFNLIHPFLRNVDPNYGLSPDPADAAIQHIKTHLSANPKEVRDELLNMLFHCEYVILVEYLECIIPMVYTIYSKVVFYMPNVIYYPSYDNITEAKLYASLANIIILIVLEVISLVALGAFLSRKLRLPVFHQLAFVLENQATLIQLKLLTWISFCLFFTEKHNGVDFTMTFDWVYNRPS